MKFYVYIYRDPTSGQPFYVGKGKGPRYSRHLKRQDKHPLTQKIQKLSALNEEPRIDVIEMPSEGFALRAEEFLIAYFGRKDLGLGPLLNLTDGGEGSSGIKMSQATKDKLSLAFRGKRQTPETIAKRMAGRKPLSEEARERISKSKRGVPLTEEHKAKLAAAKLGKVRGPRSEETKAKISASKRKHQDV